MTARLLVFGFTLVLSISSSIFLNPSVKQAQAATYTDCSDVFTSLSSYVTDGVNANKSFYVQAMNETGVPWELLAAIHYRETNFSHTNPSNGQGIFQFASGAGGPYPAGTVSDSEFYRQLKFMAQQIQSNYALRNSPNAASVTPRALTANDQDINLIKNTLYSYNGRSSQYASQATQYGYNASTQPYEGSPYVMNRFDCPRARMGIITQDYGNIDSTDTRYGAFTVFARLRGDSYWLAMTQAYSWIVNTQEMYNDPNRSIPTNIALLSPNTTYYARLTVRNIGSATWSNTGSNPVDVGTAGPQDRTSSFCDSSWLSCQRAARLVESSVPPGQLGTFLFSMKTPNSVGNYKEYFNLVAEGASWMNDIGMNWQLTNAPPTQRWQAASQQLYTDSAYTLPANPDALAPNTKYYARIQALNIGNTTWTNSGANPVDLGASNPQDRISSFCDSTWHSCNRAATLTEASVAPGQVGTFQFWMQAPYAVNGTTFNERFTPVMEGKMWMNDVGLYLPISTQTPITNWQYLGQSSYSDANYTTPADLSQATINTTYYLQLKLKNTGGTVWKNNGNNPLNLGTSNPQNRTSSVCATAWLSCNRATTLQESSVTPGQTGTFRFAIKTPATALNSKEYFEPVIDGQAWLTDIGLYWQVTSH